MNKIKALKQVFWEESRVNADPNEKISIPRLTWNMVMIVTVIIFVIFLIMSISHSF